MTSADGTATSGDALSTIKLRSRGSITLGPFTNTFNQSCTYSYTALAEDWGRAAVNPGGSWTSAAGSITGRRYAAVACSVIDTGGGGGTFFPGTISGQLDGGAGDVTSFYA